MKTTVMCPLCLASQARQKYHKFSLWMYQCSRCGVVFTWPMPPANQLAERYSRDWFEREYLPSYGIDPNDPQLDHLKPRYTPALDALEPFRKNGRLLDVGAGAGLFLSQAQQRGWSVAGVELSAYGPQYAQQHFGITIQQGTLLEAQFPDDSFDVVLLEDTIEHLPDPHDIMCMVNRILRVGGAVILSTPNFDSLGRRIAGKQWALVSPAEHTHLFTMDALLTLLRRTGFEPFRLETGTGVNPTLVHDDQQRTTRLRQRVLRQLATIIKPTVLHRYSLGDEIYATGVKQHSVASN